MDRKNGQISPVRLGRQFLQCLLWCLAWFALSVLVFWKTRSLVTLLPLGLSVLYGLRALSLARWWKRFQESGPESARQLLRRLPPDWECRYGEPYHKGRLDALVCSPAGSGWAIDVRSCEGEILFARGQLHLRDVQGRVSPLGTDVLTAVSAGATAARRRLDLSTCQPVLVFTHAQLRAPGLVQGVQLLEARHLLRHLTAKDGLNLP